MGNIVLLDELTINKIAAGEVIERPASVIKEMVENSIDAGADNITIEIKNGGISYIRITDDGKGIRNDDMDLAFERHATSKIRVADDLETVKSMGFRGEALASIAAISNVEVVSKTEEDSVGMKVIVEAGKILSKEETAAQTGTTITVTNLFFNTPVRYKFLKKDYTESGYIEDVITRLALINPYISFKLINTGKTIIQTTGDGKLQNVIYSIYGKDIAEAIVPVEYEYEEVKVSGMIGKPEIARSNRANQLFFVNNRYIKDRTITSATEQAFKGMIPIGKFCFAVLNVELEPNKVDVNVHPAKLEVRFEEENKVFKAVYYAIKEALLKVDLTKTTQIDSDKEEEPTEKKLMSEANINYEEHRSLFGNFFKKKEKPQANIIKNANDEEEQDNLIAQIYNSRTPNSNKVEETAEVYNNIEQLVTSKPDDLLEQKPLTLPKENITVINNEAILEDNNIKEIQEKSTIEDKNTTEAGITEEQSELTTKAETPSEEQVELATKLLAMQQNMEQMKEELQSNNNKMKEELKTQTSQFNVKEIVEKLDNVNATKLEDSADFDEMYVRTFGKMPVKEKNEEEEKLLNAKDLIEENISMFEKENLKEKIEYKYVGIAFSTYILIQIEKDLYLIDQHAAHERILYEQIKENFYKETEKDSQLLLLPDVITLTHKEMDIARENIDLFEKAGFTLEEFGDNTIKLTGVPDICIDLDTKELFLETLDQINTVAITAKQEKEEKFIETVACKAAVKANMALTKEEVDSLMDKLLKLPNPFTCPHGRPTAIRMNKIDIEKKFLRR